MIVCKACKAANPELSDELLLPQAPPTRGNSTVVGGARPKLPTEMSLEQALHRVLELEERLKTQADMFQELMTKQFPQPLQDAVHTPGNVHGQSVNVNVSSLNASDTQSPDNSNVNNGSGNTSTDASLWRTRLPSAFVSRALSVNPLTKDQLTRRKQGTELPPFNGDPLDWLTFIRRYLETSGEMCGFTPTEDMTRIRNSLSGHALSLVEPYMHNPDNLDSVINALQQNFGQRYMMLDAIALRIKKLPNLAEDLSNIGRFAGEVDQVRIVSNMDTQQPVPSHCVAELESKLPDRHADRWLDKRGIHVQPEINALADFLMELHTRQIALRRATVVKTKVRQVLHIHDEVEIPSTDISPVVERQKLARGQGEPKPCVFRCTATHMWRMCPKFKELSVRARWAQVRKFRRCFACLERHPKGECATDAVCNIEGCRRNHHPLLHPAGTRVEEVVHYTEERLKTTFFRLLPVEILVNGVERQIMCMMDSGSSVTLMQKDLAADLGLHGAETSMALSWADGDIREVVSTQRVTFTLRNPTSRQMFQVSANTYRDLRLSPSKVTRRLLIEEGLAHLPISTDTETVPLLLIGQDNSVLMRTLRSWEGDSKTLFAAETPLGTTLEGETRQQTETVLITDQESDPELLCLLMAHINDEKFGLGDDSALHYESDSDMQARKTMEQSTHRRLTDSHYETSLLWRDDSTNLPDNREAVRERHLKWEKALLKEPQRQKQVMDLMARYLEKGYMRPAPSDKGTPGRTWYLPIFTTVNPMKPEKTRVVWDCAAKYYGKSLNDVLVSGPDLTVPLVNVLMRFRRGRYAISGDIEEMFHQVFVREEDRSAQRFYWRDNVNEELRVMELCVLSFGATCSPTLAQYVKNTNAQSEVNENPRAVQAIQEDHYVDDYLDCDDEESVLLKRADQVRRIHANGGMKMHKFTSNSAVILHTLGVPADTVKKVSLSGSSILGLSWNTTNDCLSFRFSRDRFATGLMDGTESPTRRQMLRVVMSIFDPLGLVSFLTMEGKIVLREAWRMQGKWDDPLDGGIQRRWASWTHHLSTIEDIVIPRWHGTVAKPVELHVFSDASENAICATGYVVQELPEGRISSLCFAKCLLAPLKTKSIPRLELDAAVLGTRVASVIRAAHPWEVTKVHHWTDAKDVLYWLRCPYRRYSPYVANRVANLLSYTTEAQWRWVPTDQNPADWGTKWMVSRKSNDLWWRGPEFLQEEESMWPDCELEKRELLEVRPLLSLTHHTPRHCLVPEVSRFSNWSRLVGTCATSLNFLAILRKKRYPGPVTEEERRRAENQLFIEMQRGILAKPGRKKFLTSLCPFVDDNGVMRMRSRLARAESLSYDSRYPIILDEEHPAVVLLVMYYHRKNNHQLTSVVVNELRQRVVFFNMVVTVRRIVSGCAWCMVRRAGPVMPQMGSLHSSRVAVFRPPFSFVGLDYFGPVLVTIGRRHEKRWVALFTCLTIRAVYLEIVASLSGNSCMMALDSLIARRGTPVRIHSDNATCFVAASKEYQGPNGVRPEWSFIPPNSPSMGGAWERLVGVVKSALRNMDLGKTPSEETLRRTFTG